RHDRLRDPDVRRQLRTSSAGRSRTRAARGIGGRMTTRRMSRRRFGVIAGGGLGAAMLGGACTETFQLPLFDGRLKSRPGSGATTSAPGDHPLGIDKRRDAVLHLPAGTNGERLPLLVLLHGASGSGEGVLRRLSGALEGTTVAVLAPSSRDGTWDAIRGGFG